MAKHCRYMNITMDVNPETTSNRYDLVPSAFSDAYMLHAIYKKAAEPRDYAFAWISTEQLARIIFTNEEDGI